MNERIQELAVQANLLIKINEGQVRGGTMELKLEKFAELIIEECAFQCQHLGDMERIGKHFEVDVFKQFGV